MPSLALRANLLFRSLINEFTRFPSGRLDTAIRWINDGDRSFVELTELLRLFRGDNNKSKIAAAWIAKEEKTVLDLREVLLLFPEGDQSRIALAWLRTEGKTIENLREAVSLFPNAEDKSLIALGWFRRRCGVKEDLEEWLPLVLNKYRPEILRSFLTQNNNEESKYNDLLHFAKAGLVGSMYDLQNIAETYRLSKLPVARFPEFCKTLYPTNENLQSELFCEGIRIFAEAPLLQNKSSFLDFVTSLESDQYALESLAALKTKVALTRLEILQASTNRLNRNYESLSELLCDKLVVESLTPEGLTVIQNEFSGALPQDTNLASLFSFYQIQESPEVAMSLFKSILKSEILQEMRNKFIPSDQNVLVSGRDFQAMSHLLNEEGFNIWFLPIPILSNHLAASTNFSNLSTAEIDTYKLGKSQILSEEERVELKTKENGFSEEFKTMLRENNVSNIQVGEFFEKVLSLETPINDRERESLKDFFNRDKFLLARLLQQDGGLDKFAGAITALADGCFANIASQARISLTQSLITDPCDQILFRVFGEKVNGPILANFNVDHIAEGADAAAIFQDPRFVQHCLSPTGLVRAIKEEFFKDGKKVEDSQKFLTKVVGDIFYQRHYTDVDEFFYEKGATTKLTTEILETYFANLSALTIIKTKLPKLLENRHLSGFDSKVADLNSLLPPPPSLLPLLLQPLPPTPPPRTSTNKTSARAVEASPQRDISS